MGIMRNLILRWARARPPHFVIGGNARPYLLRWWLTPWSRAYRNVPDEDKTWWQWFVTRLPGAYVHLFLRSDDDRALHDHPWMNLSVLLEGQYTEHTIAAGGINVKTVRRAGDWYFRRSGRMAHRVELTDGPCWTLFVTGWRYREWGFHCPDRGWIHWKKFTASDDAGAVGKG